MAALPRSIQNLIDQFYTLPGIGKKTAERLVFFLLSQNRSQLAEFAQALNHLTDNITVCETCYNFTEKNPCEICHNPKRDHNVIAVVARPQDVAVLEKTGEFNGLYHVLGGTINLLENRGPQQIKIAELENRIKKQEVKEIILSLNPDIEGETTILYLNKLLSKYPIKITRLARGLPMGSDIEYADETTLANALKGRKEL